MDESKLFRGSEAIEGKDKREGGPRASLDVRVDHEKLGGIEEGEVAKGKGQDLPRDVTEVRVAGIRSVFEALRKLPPLSFPQGPVLFFGENGSGKTSLVRAILFAAEIQQAVDCGDARERAEELLLRPVTRGDKMDLLHAGLAPSIAKAIDVTALEVGDTSLPKAKRRPVRMQFEDCTRAKETALFGDSDMMDRAGLSSMEDVAGAMSTTLSQRQLVDRNLATLKEEDSARPTWQRIRGFDEPETGMSPKRQLGLVTEIKGLTPEGSISLVATNSVILYESDLPRIDFDHPERGVHRPSEYPDHE